MLVKKPNLLSSFPVAIAGHDFSGSPPLLIKVPGFFAVVEKKVDADIFHQGQEHKGEAYNYIDVDGLDTGKLGEFIPQVRVDGVEDEH